MPWLTPVLDGSEITRYNPINYSWHCLHSKECTALDMLCLGLRNFCPHSSDVRLIGTTPSTPREFHTTTGASYVDHIRGGGRIFLSTSVRLASQLRQWALMGTTVYDVCGTLRSGGKPALVIKWGAPHPITRRLPLRPVLQSKSGPGAGKTMPRLLKAIRAWVNWAGGITCIRGCG